MRRRRHLIPWLLLPLLMSRVRWLLLIRRVPIDICGRAPLIRRPWRRPWRTTNTCTRSSRGSTRSGPVVRPLLLWTLRWILSSVLSAWPGLPTAWVHLGPLIRCVRLWALLEVRMAPGLVRLWVGKRLFLLLAIVVGR